MALAPVLAAQAANGRVLLRTYGRRAEPETAAQALFAALRALDAEAPDVILAAGIGERAIGGKLPVTIPGLFPAGHGLERAAVAPGAPIASSGPK